MEAIKKFTRTKEDFECEKCGAFVEGDGYTNHCPHCLYSLHVDIYPGDRKAGCGGLMDPVGLEEKNGRYRVTHQCLICGYTKINMISKDDDFSVVLAIAKKIAEEKNR
ncbi:MAG: RNHCP domain-containing protein [Patescibacteria group bacterium]